MPRPVPNPKTSLATIIAVEFLASTAFKSETLMNQLILDNAARGGSMLGFSYQGIIFSPHDSVHKRTDYVEEIHSSLLRMGEALYLRTDALRSMQLKLQQALVSILTRCNSDFQTFRDALPDEFVKETQLDIVSRGRAQGFLLRANPMLLASYRVLDEAMLFRNKYRLLDA